MIDIREPWVKASKWVKLDREDQDLTKSLGIFPVNDAFVPIWEKDYDILLAFGGRGGGKSEQLCQLLITECRNEEYFKCYYGRKVFDTVRGSCFETLIHNIKQMGVEDEFHFSEAATSSMKIIHKKTLNSFVPFGSDKASKLKSIKDPTHLWGEELDQFTLDDLLELMPTLRTERGANRFYGTFNTHNVHPRHWLLKYFFPELYEGEDKPEFDILKGQKVKKLLVNYTDNYFIDQEAYYNRLKLSSGGSTRLLNSIAHGEFGSSENNAPWLYALDHSKHVKPTLPFLPSFPVYLSFDFNREPVTCVAFQQSPDIGKKDSFLHYIKQFKGDFQLSELCERIKAAFPASILEVTGDAAGNKGDIGFVGRHSTYYTMIQSYLNLRPKQMKINSHNLEHHDSRLLCNTILSNYPNIYFSKEGCPDLISDCEIAEVDDKSNKPGHLKKDRERFKLDLFDGFRYSLQTYYYDFASKVYLTLKK